MKEPKQKTCIVCKVVFTPPNSLARVCNYSCAATYAREQRLKSQAKENKIKLGLIKHKSHYLKDLQININAIIKYIDYKVECVSSGMPLEDNRNSGHLWSVGSNPAIRFNLFNIHNQSISDNKYKGGNPLEYVNGLRKMYGNEYAEYCLALKAKYKTIHLTIEEIKEKIIISKLIINELKNNIQYYNPIERIELRKMYNIKLGIYID